MNLMKLFSNSNYKPDDDIHLIEFNCIAINYY